MMDKSKKSPAKPKKEPAPNPGVEVGDEVFFHHPESGPMSGKVLAHGKHGATIAADGKHHRIGWDGIRGHKARAEMKASIVEHGDDGAILEMGDGSRRFVQGNFGEMMKDQTMNKAIAEVLASRSVVFFKSHVKSYTRKDGVLVKEHDDKRQKKAGAPAAGKYGTHDIQPGSKVKFKAGEHAGAGKVTAVGKDGATVEDSTGREHSIMHHEITHHEPGEGVKKPEIKNTVLGEQKPIEADKFDAAAYAKSHDQEGVTVEDILSGFPEDTGDRIKAAQDRLKGIEQTIETFKKDGKWNASREVLHSKIISELLSPERVKAATPKDGAKPKFTILGGRGGSGKSSFEGTVYNPAEAIVLDADHIKGLIPEYEGWNAHQVHEESGELFDKITDLAQELGLNIVHDATMKTGHKAVALVKRFNDARYDTEAHYMHLPRQEAAKRAVGRFLGGGEKGRYVPIDVVLGNTTNETSFDQVKHLVSKWSFRDNNVPKGEKPILISESGAPGGESAETQQSVDESKDEGMHKSLTGCRIYLWRKV